MPNKILIISDTHLSDRFDRSKFLFLKNLILSSDSVIINGDFWDSWLTNFDDFIKSPWQKLFPILCEKKCKYLFGNHDPENLSDDRVRAFSEYSNKEYEFSTKKYEFKLCHGDEIAKNRNFIIKTYINFLENINGKGFDRKIFKILKNIEKHAYSVFGVDFVTNSRLGRNLNEDMKNFRVNSYKDKWLICGDTHTAEIDRENMYVNSGCIIHGWGSYVIIDQNKIELKKENYINF